MQQTYKLFSQSFDSFELQHDRIRLENLYEGRWLS